MPWNIFQCDSREIISPLNSSIVSLQLYGNREEFRINILLVITTLKYFFLLPPPFKILSILARVTTLKKSSEELSKIYLAQIQ